MKVLNHSRLLTIARNYILFFIFSFVVATIVSIYIHEKTDLWAQVIDPKFLGQNIVNVSMWLLSGMFVLYCVFCIFHILSILREEYLNVWDNFIEGPSESGERQVLSFSQVRYMGRDVLGRFSIVGDEEKIILPGKLSVSSEREILRQIKQAQLEHNL